jgi:hydroxymethylglutaryl-CoA lyase
MAMAEAKNATGSFPDKVKIVEVGVRDGLQNEATLVSTQAKVELIERLAEAGLTAIEAGSFVSPKWVPQMADTAEVLQRLHRKVGIAYPVLVPNMKGLEQALAADCKEVSIFAAASEAFSQRNINCSIAESMQRFAPVVERALSEGLLVRGYVSCVLDCPYTGPVAADIVAEVALQLYRMGCYEISLGDTTGAGTPRGTRQMIEACAREVPVSALAGHFHDTFGMAAANIYAALESGVSVFDSSVAGLGGCPYSPGATGNVATEDVCYLMQGMGIETGIDMQALIAAGDFICAQISRKNGSRVANAYAAKKEKAARNMQQHEATT